MTAPEGDLKACEMRFAIDPVSGFVGLNAVLIFLEDMCLGIERAVGKVEGRNCILTLHYLGVVAVWGNARARNAKQ